MPDPTFTFDLGEATFITGFGEWTYTPTGRTAKMSYKVNCNRKPANFEEVDQIAAALPQPGEEYAPGDGRFVTKVTIRTTANSTDVIYAEAEFGPNQLSQNPLLRPDTVGLEVASETQDWFLDADNKPTVNSAGEIFDKIPPRTTGGIKLIITGNRAVLPAAALVGVSRPHRTNSSAITVRGITIPTGSAKLSGAGGSPQTENGVTYYSVRWELTLAETWEIDLDDRGFNEKDGTAGKLKPIMVAGVQTQVPYPLDGSGAKKSDPSQAPALIHLKPYKQDGFSYGWTSAA